MKVFKKSTGQVAERDKDRMFVCEVKRDPPLMTEYKYFDEIEEAASWLCQNPKWGIRMNPNWSLIYRDIAIDRDS